MIGEITKLLLEKQQKFCVLGTASKNAMPWTSVMGYAVYDDKTILLSTHKNSRKWHNINENNRVSLVFGFGFEELYVQCEGIAKIIESGEEFVDCEKMFFAQNPTAKAFKNESTIFVKVKLNKVCVTNFQVSPSKVEEHSI